MFESNKTNQIPISVGNDEIIYIYYLRIISTFGVILLHAVAYQFPSVEVTSNDWMILNCLRSVVTMAVPNFIMISGALSLSKDYDYKTLRRKIGRILSAFFFWSLIYSFHSYRNGAELGYCIKYFFKGCYHMWFCPMIIGLYLIIPFLKTISKSNGLTKYFICLSFIFAFVIPRISSIFLVKWNLEVADTLTYILNGMHFYFVLGYVGYFIIGSYLHRIQIPNKFNVFTVIMTLISILLIILLSRSETIKSGTTSELYYSSFSCLVFLASIGIYIIFKQFCPKNTSKKCLAIIKTISNCCFGVYLIHVLVLEKSMTLIPEYIYSFHGLSALFLSLITFIISCTIIYIIRLIPNLGKHIT